jgi:hypothetical protein
MVRQNAVAMHPNRVKADTKQGTRVVARFSVWVNRHARRSNSSGDADEHGPHRDTSVNRCGIHRCRRERKEARFT